MKNKKTVRKYYALEWKSGLEFKYDYDTIPMIDACVAIIVVFNKKQDRDEYVDRWHDVESIPASIARKLIKYIGAVYNKEVKTDDDLAH